MADGIDVLLAAANAAQARRKEGIDQANETTEMMVNTMQNNRKLGILDRQASVEEQMLPLKARSVSVEEQLAGLKGQELEIEKIKAEQMNKLLGSFLSQGAPGSSGSSNIPPGTTFTANGVTIPLNQKLTESEQSSVAGAQSLDPIIKEIESILGTEGQDFSDSDKGLMGDIKRTAEQMAVDSAQPLLTSKSKRLADLQSKFSTLKKTLPFTEGGKQLTKTEKQQVFALLNVSGKDDARIKNDINEAMAILRKKEQIALGGANAARDKGASNLPAGVTEENIKFTMEKHKLTRDQVLARLK